MVRGSNSVSCPLNDNYMNLFFVFIYETSFYHISLIKLKKCTQKFVWGRKSLKGLTLPQLFFLKKSKLKLFCITKNEVQLIIHRTYLNNLPNKFKKNNYKLDIRHC